MKNKINLVKMIDEELNKLKKIMRTTSSIHNNIIFITPNKNINLPTTNNFERFNKMQTKDIIQDNLDKAYQTIKIMESIADTQEGKEKINEYKEMIDKTEKLISKLYNKQETKQPKKKRFELVLDCSDELKDIILEYISSLKGMQDEEIMCTEVKDYKTIEELQKLHTPKFNIEDHKFEVDDKINSLNFTININEMDCSDLDVNERLEIKSVADRIIYEGKTYELVEEDDNYYYYEHKDVKKSLQNFLKEFEHDDKSLYNRIKHKLIKHCGNNLIH